jgi:hypothetical protein
VVVLALAGLWWKADRMLAAREAVGYQRRATEDAAAANEQAARNRELQRVAELKYTVRAASRDKFFDQTAKEIHDAAAPLASCPVPEPVRVRLNAAATCARGDTAASCGDADAVPDAR